MEEQPDRALWIGAAEATELGLAKAWAGEMLAAHGSHLVDFLDPAEAVAARRAGEPTPRVALLAATTPTRWTIDDAVALSLAWPLMPIVSVATSLVDGRRRSGPVLPGIEEVAWFDLPGRLESWLAHWDAGRVGTLALPTTMRRDERLLPLADGVSGSLSGRCPIAVVAATPLDAGGIAALVTAAGGAVAGTSAGRPPLDGAAAILVWEVPRVSADHLSWLRLLSANRSRLRTVIVESFPRGETVQAALDAGAAAVLGRPLSLEALAGRLRRLEAALDGLGEPSQGR
jgi:hypothetical protein